MSLRKYLLQCFQALLLASACAVRVSAAPDADPLPSIPTAPDATTLAAANVPPSADPPPGPNTPSQNVTINLINRLVKRGVLTKKDAKELIQQAEDDAAQARAQTVALSPPPAGPDDTRVTYVPEVVKTQMRDEIKAEVLQQARDEGWTDAKSLPSWVPRFRFTGDVRTRYEGDFFPGSNDNTGAFPIFNAINTGAPFDTAGTQFSPQYDVDQDRNRIRLRVRFGAEMDLGENFSAGVRIATGENDSPVTENQSLGVANNGQGGNFSKYAVWLDRGFLKYELGGTPEKDLTVSVGRFENPFWDPTTIIWANTLGFDGAVIQARYPVTRSVTPFVVAGAFPVFNTDFNFATNQPTKFHSEDKWLYAAQTGADWKINKDFDLKAAVAYYHFQNVEGRLSNPYTPLTAADQGSTDDTRPAFAQNGNTYMALRDIVPNANNNFGAIDQFQYYGLATPFHEIAWNGRLDYNHFEPFQISLIGLFEENLAFDRGAVSAKAVNNRGSSTLGTGAFAGGNTAWTFGVIGGDAALEKRWDWNVETDYRYVESDSVIDGFNDADFGAPLTGTNLKGFTVGGNLALSANVWLGLRWMSAEAIVGPTYKSDLIQFDLTGKF